MTRAVNTALAGSGGVLQVVQGSNATQTTTTSTSYSDSSLSLSITPSSASSRILVVISQQLTVRGPGGTASFNAGGLQLVRASTTVFTNNNAAVLRADGSGGTPASGGLVSLVYLDSPSTTSSTTYKTQIRSNDGSGQVIAQDGNTLSTITLMEIAG